MAVEQGGLQRFLRAGPLTWVLAAVCGWALLFWLGSLLGLGARSGELPPLPAEALPSPAAMVPDRIGPLAQYAEAASRPLFTEDRKPRAFLATAPDEGEAGASSSMNFILTGVLISPNVQLAILQPNGGGNSQRVRVGSAPDGAAGWRLQEVQPRRAIFEGPGGQMTLDLRTFGVAGAPAGASKAAAEAAAVADAAAAGPPLPPPTPDESRRIDEIRKRIEARRAQLQQHNQAPPPPRAAANSTTSATHAPASAGPVLQEVKE
jgi:general secretion pathway protein N